MVLKAVLAVILALSTCVAAAETGHADEIVKLDTGAVPVESVRQDIERSFQLPKVLASLPGVTSEDVKSAIATECSRIKSLMRFSGYLLADVDCGSATPGVIKPVLGQIFRIATVEVDGTADLGLEPQARQDLAAYLQRFAGPVATRQERSSVEEGIIRVLAQNNYPLAKVESSDVVTYADVQLARLVLKIDAGPIPNVGRLTIRGLQTIPASSLLATAPLKAGSRFDAAKLKSFETQLIASKKFQEVRVSVSRFVDTDGSLPIVISVKENLPEVNPSLVARSGLWVGLAAGIAIFAVIIAEAFGSRKRQPAHLALKVIAVLFSLLALVIFIVRFLELTKGIV